MQTLVHALKNAVRGAASSRTNSVSTEFELFTFGASPFQEQNQMENRLSLYKCKTTFSNL